MQCNAMQCNAMQCNAMQCNAMQCNTIQYNTIQVVDLLQAPLERESERFDTEHLREKKNLISYNREVIVLHKGYE